VEIRGGQSLLPGTRAREVSAEGGCPGRGYFPDDSRHFVPLEFGHLQSLARSGLKRIAQGLPWESPPPELALEGSQVTARIGSEPLNRIACAFPAPSASGHNVYFPLTHGKPWAKLSCPFRAEALRAWLLSCCPSGTQLDLTSRLPARPIRSQGSGRRVPQSSPSSGSADAQFSRAGR
jgi:hypothetical protein